MSRSFNRFLHSICPRFWSLGAIDPEQDIFLSGVAERLEILLGDRILVQSFLQIIRYDKCFNCIEPGLIEIPRIGQTFVKDFARLGIVSQVDLVGKSAEDLFQPSTEANAQSNHKTSKNYLYVIRMAFYYAEGGHDSVRLK